jgi:ubiquinol-cytochrome c reductase cytochrome b subunit
MFGSIALLALAPWLDTSRVRSSRYRPMYKWYFWLLAIDFMILMWIGAQPAEGIYLIIGRLATAYWFVHFLLVMPIIGLIEKPLPQPETVEQAFNQKHNIAQGSAGK